MIQIETKGKMAALDLGNPYPQNYQTQVAQVVREKESGFIPPLKARIDSMEKYEVVFVGFPTWDKKIPTPIKSFLRQYNLAGKTVVPFNTNAGYGVGSGFETVKQLYPNSKVLDGFTTKGGIERDGVLFVMEGEKEKQAKEEVKPGCERLFFKLSVLDLKTSHEKSIACCCLRFGIGDNILLSQSSGTQPGQTGSTTNLAYLETKPPNYNTRLRGKPIFTL